MTRREFLHRGLETAWAATMIAAVPQPGKQLDEAADVLTRAVAGGQMEGAVLHVERRGSVFVRCFGSARSPASWGQGSARFNGRWPAAD